MMGNCLSKQEEEDFFEKFVKLQCGAFDGSTDEGLIDVQFWSKFFDYNFSKVEIGI